MKILISMIVMLAAFSQGAFAHDHHWDHGDASGDQHPKSFGEGYESAIKHFDDGVIFFPGAEIGFGSGSTSFSLGLNFGYKSGLFMIGTALKGQIVNIDHVNYQVMPLTLNLFGLSFSKFSETSNNQNDKTLRGSSLGFGLKGKLAFGQMVEYDPVTNSEKEFLTLNFGVGF